MGIKWGNESGSQKFSVEIQKIEKNKGRDDQILYEKGL